MASLRDDEFFYLNRNGVGLEVVDDEIGNIVRQSFDQAPLSILTKFEKLLGDRSVVDRVAQVIRCRCGGERVLDGEANEQALRVAPFRVRNAYAVLHFKVFDDDLIHSCSIYEGRLLGFW